MKCVLILEFDIHNFWFISRQNDPIQGSMVEDQATALVRGEEGRDSQNTFDYFLVGALSLKWQ